MAKSTAQKKEDEAKAKAKNAGLMQYEKEIKEAYKAYPDPKKRQRIR